MLTVEITPLNFRRKHVKVGQPSDTFIKLVPFIWGSISEGTIIKRCQNNYDWMGVSKERHRLLAVYLLNVFVVQLVHTNKKGQYNQ